VFRDLSVNNIVIPPASTGTTAISRAAVQTNDHVYRLAVWRENVALFAYPTVDRTLIAPDSDDRPTACNAMMKQSTLNPP